MARSKSTFKSYLDQDEESETCSSLGESEDAATPDPLHQAGGVLAAAAGVRLSPMMANRPQSGLSNQSTLSRESKMSSDPDSDWEHIAAQTYSKLHPTLLPGDMVLAEVNIVEKFRSDQNALYGKIFCTKFKIAFVPLMEEHDQDPPVLNNKLYDIHDIPLSSIHSIYQVSRTKQRKLAQGLTGFGVHKRLKKLSIQCKNFKTHTFGFPSSRHSKANITISELISRIMEYTYTPSKEFLFATKFKHDIRVKAKKHPQYRNKTDWNAELSRLHVTGYKTLDFNDNFALNSMPCCFVCPESLSVADIKQAAVQFRDDRPPSWSYTHRNGANLVRMSSLITQQTEIQTKMYSAVAKAGARVKKDVVNVSNWMPSIKALQSSFDKLRELCVQADEVLDAEWLSSVESSHWLEYVGQGLRCAVEVVDKLCAGKNVIIQEDGDRDMNAVISCLVQLMMDPHCRTLKGFEHLVQRQWIAMGHKFSDRCGLLANREEQSPVFLFFLDCVWQISQQYPASFQFSEIYLITLWDSICIGFFESFIYNSDYERMNPSSYMNRSPTSVWLWELQFESEDLTLGRNPLYVAATELRQELDQLGASRGTKPYYLSLGNEGRSMRAKDSTLVPNYRAPMVQLWSYCYLRWQVSQIQAGGSPMEYLQQCVLVDEILQLQQQIAELDGDGSGHERPLFSPLTNQLAGSKTWLTSSFPFSMSAQPYITANQNTSLETVLNSSNILSSCHDSNSCLDDASNDSTEHYEPAAAEQELQNTYHYR